MLLAEVAKIGELEITRDAAFQTLGFLSNTLPGMVGFLEDERYLPLLERTAEAACVITTPALAPLTGKCAGCAISAEPRRSFHLIHTHLANCGFYWTDFETQIHSSARIHPRAWVAENNVRIGPGTQVGANATILERSVLGAENVIGPGRGLGSPRFQSLPFVYPTQKMFHSCTLSVADRVHILANAVIASALVHQSTQICSE